MKVFWSITSILLFGLGFLMLDGGGSQPLFYGALATLCFLGCLGAGIQLRKMTVSQGGKYTLTLLNSALALLVAGLIIALYLSQFYSSS